MNATRATLKVEDVVSVYSGRPGCCCGCRGKHTYSSAWRELAAARYGAVRDATVRQVVAKVLAAPAEGVEEYDGFISWETPTHLYVVYTQS